MANNKIPCSLLLAIAILYLFNSAQALISPQSYETVNKYCNQKYTKNPDFCLKVLKSDSRSATAKDNKALLLIIDDLSIKTLTKTSVYIANLYKKDPNLKECVDAYTQGIGQLKIIPAELKDDPSTASYDALQASDAMVSCSDSLQKHKISDPYVLSSQKNDQAYVNLVVDISRTIN